MPDKGWAWGSETIGGVSRFQVLSDAQWSLIEELLLYPTGRPGRKFSDARTMVESIVYRYRVA